MTKIGKMTKSHNLSYSPWTKFPQFVKIKKITENNEIYPTNNEINYTQIKVQINTLSKTPKKGSKRGDPFFGPPAWGYPQNPGF